VSPELLCPVTQFSWPPSGGPHNILSYSSVQVRWIHQLYRTKTPSLKCPPNTAPAAPEHDVLSRTPIACRPTMLLHRGYNCTLPSSRSPRRPRPSAGLIYPATYIRLRRTARAAALGMPNMLDLRPHRHLLHRPRAPGPASSSPTRGHSIPTSGITLSPACSTRATAASPTTGAATAARIGTGVAGAWICWPTIWQSCSTTWTPKM